MTDEIREYILAHPHLGPHALRVRIRRHFGVWLRVGEIRAVREMATDA